MTTLLGAYDRLVGFVRDQWRHLVVGGLLALALVLGLLDGLAGSSVADLIGRTREAGFVVPYLALSSMSFLAAHWYMAVPLDLGAALVWSLVPVRAWDALTRRVPAAALVRWGILFLNRQLGHLTAIGTWIFVVTSLPEPALVRVAGLPYPGARLYFALVAAVVVYATPIADALGRHGIGRSRTRTSDDPHWRRRPVYYAATLLGGAILLLVATPELQNVARLFAATALATTVRLARWLAHTFLPRGVALDDELTHAREWGRRLDRPALALFLLAVFVPFGAPLRASAANHDRFWRETHLRGCPDATPASGTSIFIVSDSQFRELRGNRTGGHLDLVDDVVPVAVRPVELDLLSGATLAHFAEVFRGLPAEPRWVHLGDAADLGCSSELERFRDRYVEAFGVDRLAGIAPGNHDAFFTGNFGWHPDWTRACALERSGGDANVAVKAASDALLADVMTRGAGPEGRETRTVDVRCAPTTALSTTTYGEGRTLLRVSHWSGAGALAAVAPLGTLPDGRRLLGVFLDTSDFTGFVLGLAGAQGGVSACQVKAVEAVLAQRVKDDVSLILFLHHPYEELSWLSQRNVRRLVRGRPVLAVVAAHTHLAAQRRPFTGDPELAVVPELVVGSTTDPPQEAALLSVTGAAGRYGVELHTIPAVAREGHACGGEREHPLGAATCATLVRDLLREERCAPLALDHLANRQPMHPRTPGEVAESQELRARRLLACVCRAPASCDVPGAPPLPLDGSQRVLADPYLFERLDRLALTAAASRRRELVCLSWAASVMQSAKAHHVDFNRALAEGFDGAATLGAIRMEAGPAPAATTARLSP